MNLKEKVKQVSEDYQQIIKQVQQLDQQRNDLIHKGTQLEGQLILLDQQVKELEAEQKNEITSSKTDKN